MNKIVKYSNKLFIRVSKAKYENFLRFFPALEGDFFMDWEDFYDFSLSSGKYEKGTWDYAAECKVARHYVSKHAEYYISLDYIKAKNYDLNTVVPKPRKPRKPRLTEEEDLITKYLCEAFDNVFKGV